MQSLIPVMTPAPGSRLLHFVGDCVRFELRDRDYTPPPQGWRAMLRTNLGRAAMLRREIIDAQTRGLPPAGAAWRDLPMRPHANGGWALELPVSEPGFFKAKAYLVDPRGWQHWPEGPDAGISVHPNSYRTANTICCAFTRLFGETKTARVLADRKKENELTLLDKAAYTVIPPSGKLRDLTKSLPHIFDTLGCRILHILPIHPTPTTFARFGRFGSPYAALDLTAIDPALVVFDKRTTGIDQFRELTYETHLRGGRLFLDIVINHTGWGSVLHENHPDWFLRNPDGTFVSPGAWGTVWEDLVELKHQNVELWDKLAAMFLTWCRRGVDGFRCDAAYKVPAVAWQYIIARVHEEYPETIFLAEGLGGSWEATETLLTEGGMQWAYSELFQNYTGAEIGTYLGYAHSKSEQVGLLVHYSETHDNDRLAAKGRAWSLLRNRLCALTSNNGGFGFTCGVEWLASEKIKVHGCTGLAWGDSDNIVPELAALNRLLSEHPCFFDGARLQRLSPKDSHAYVLRRESEEGKDLVLVLVNTDVEKPRAIILPRLSAFESSSVPLSNWIDLLGQKAPETKIEKSEEIEVTLPAGACFCLSPTARPQGLSGDDYRRARAQAAWAVQALSQCLPAKVTPNLPWRELASLVDQSPFDLLAAVSWLGRQFGDNDDAAEFLAKFGSLPSLQKIIEGKPFPTVVEWFLGNRNRVTLVPPGHWLLIVDSGPFRASLQFQNDDLTENIESIVASGKHIACFAPRHEGGDGSITLERYAAENQRMEATIRFLEQKPASHVGESGIRNTQHAIRSTDLVLLTNGRGGMARICLDLGRIRSKYDCVLAANLHPTVPVDRHVFAKRLRVWVNADGFISPLDFAALDSFAPGPPAVWNFVANAGDGRTVEIQTAATMIEGQNTTVFRFARPSAATATGKQLPSHADVRLTVRVDIEDRNFHSETHRNGGAEHHFATHCHTLQKGPREDGPRDQGPQDNGLYGFSFTPASDRQLRVVASNGAYHPQPEWSENIPHPFEQSRGQVGSGDAYSPGWFEIPLGKGAEVILVVTAESNPPSDADVARAFDESSENRLRGRGPVTAEEDRGRLGVFESQLLRAVAAFVARRGEGKTVIAGYPWFLDWGRDTFICARGLLSAGRLEDVRQILLTFARFEKDGTLPNTIYGENASNRDTSDAPLWFALVCEELAAVEYEVQAGSKPNSLETAGSRGQVHVAAAGTAALREEPGSIYETRVDSSRTLRDVLISIADNYIRGTPNGIRMDPASALIWSPSHFTWMDTNYPAGTPREGYPVEIQALWIRLLRQLARLPAASKTGKDKEGGPNRWQTLADQAAASFERLFWLEKQGYFSDVLLAKSGQPAAEALPDDALRSNCLFAMSLGLARGERVQRCVQAALRYLVVPGALRSLAPLRTSVPLPLYSKDGFLLNDPKSPYWGRYEGDEDTRRKPAYHNGTAWCWTFPTFCEALAAAWDFAPEAVTAAKAYMGSMDRLLAEGCIGQLPEILDGDAPHTQRGCDAQAWSATEALRVWRLLRRET